MGAIPATFLYRLGRPAFRQRRIVVMLWIAVQAAIGIGAMSAPGTSSEVLGVPGTQSQRAIDLLQKEFPQASAANKAKAESLVAELEKSHQVSGVTDPFTSGLVSRSGTIAYTQASYKVAQAEMRSAAHAVQTDVVQEGEKAGLKASLGGNAVKDTDPAEILRAVHLVAAGSAMLHTAAARRLIDRYHATNQPEAAAAKDRVDGLPPALCEHRTRAPHRGPRTGERGGHGGRFKGPARLRPRDGETEIHQQLTEQGMQPSDLPCHPMNFPNSSLCPHR